VLYGNAVAVQEAEDGRSKEGRRHGGAPDDGTAERRVLTVSPITASSVDCGIETSCDPKIAIPSARMTKVYHRGAVSTIHT